MNNSNVLREELLITSKFGVDWLVVKWVDTSILLTNDMRGLELYVDDESCISLWIGSPPACPFSHE